MKLRRFLQSIATLFVGIPFVGKQVARNAERPPRRLTDDLEGCFRIGSQVALLPPLTEEEIKEIMLSICCYFSNEEVRMFCESQAFRVKYRIDEREEAKREQRRIERFQMVAKFVATPRSA